MKFKMGVFLLCFAGMTFAQGNSNRMIFNMPVHDKRNAGLTLELPGQVPLEVKELACQIENRWEQGRYKEAETLIHKLDILTRGKTGYGILWKDPLVLSKTSLWDTDVQVSNRDTVLMQVLEYDYDSGGLMALLYFRDGDSWCWTVNISFDGGRTWAETFISIQGEESFVDATYLNGYFYVSYVWDSTSARIRRFDASTGGDVDLPSGKRFEEVMGTASPEFFREVALCAADPNYVYYSTITSIDSFRYSYLYIPASYWAEITSTLEDVHHGLDMAWNEGGTENLLFFSYYDSEDSLKVSVRGLGTWDELFSGWGGDRNFTAISAYHDTVYCVYEYEEAGSPFYVRYIASYDSGAAWLSSDPQWIDDQVNNECPAVDMRRGGGIGVIRGYHSNPEELQFNQREMDGAAAWAGFGNMADNEPWFGSRPSIAYLENGVFGVLYPAADGGGNPSLAFFDRSDNWTDVEDIDDAIPSEFNLSQNYPNPFNPLTEIEYALPAESHVRLEIFNYLGQTAAVLVDEVQEAGLKSVTWNAEGFASGIYFYRLKAGDMVKMRKMILVK